MRRSDAMSNKPPFQFGLGSLLVAATAFIAIAAWLDPLRLVATAIVGGREQCILVTEEWLR